MSDKLTLIKQQIESTRPTFEELAMDKTAFARELEWAVQIFKGNAYLQSMEQESVKNCLVNVALSGLSLNPVMKEAYLVPRKGKLCLDPSYMGLIKTITDSGAVKSIKAGLVYSNEPFEIEMGTGGYVKHGIVKNGQPGNCIGAYSIAILPDGTPHVEWMYDQEIRYIMSRSESVKAGKRSPWDSDFGEMARKTVVKRHWKYLPKTGRALQAAQAIAFDDEANGIDFEKERQQQEQKANAERANAISLDVLDPNNDQHTAQFNNLLGWYDWFLKSGITHLMEGSFDVEAQKNVAIDKFNTGTLTIEFADKTQAFLQEQYNAYSQPQENTEY